jgi:hypothetical protein
LLVTGAGIAPAYATSGTGYDGTDPASTGCANGSTLIYSQDLHINGNGAKVGVMEVRYSPTCGTNWVRVQNLGTTDAVSKKYILREAQGSLPRFEQGIPDTYVGWSYGNQVYAPGATCIWVQGGLVTGAWTAWSDYRQLCG